MSTVIINGRVRFDGDRDGVLEASRSYISGLEKRGLEANITYKTPDCDEIEPKAPKFHKGGLVSQNPAHVMLSAMRSAGLDISEKLASGFKRAAGICDQVVNPKGLPVADIATAEWSIGDQGRPAVKIRLRQPADERLRKLVASHSFQLHYLDGDVTRTQSGTLIEFLTIVLVLPSGAVPLSVEARFQTKAGMLSPPTSKAVTKVVTVTVNPGASKSSSK